MFDVCKTGMIGLPYDMLSRFHTIPVCYGETDGRTDRIAISISRVSSSMLTRDKNRLQTTEYGRMAVLGNRIWYVKYVLSYFVEGNLTAGKADMLL